MELTTNEKIYKVLTTKTTKVNKYMSELEAMGFVIHNGKDSAYDYWKIENPITDRDLVISKDYKNNKRLYGNCYPLNNAVKDNIKKVDFIGYLNSTRKKYVEYPKATLIDNYKNIKMNVEYYSAEIIKTKNKIDKMQEYLKHYEEQLAKYQIKKDNLFSKK